jgi:coenzyme F420-reducing hydrogenase beta subunit
MIENGLGFLEPFVAYECNNCNNCTEVCPVICEKLVNAAEPIGTYAGWSNSSEVVKDSSSGGIFYEIARLVIETTGKVSGSIMQDYRPYHITSDDLKEIATMKGAKYIQSKTLGVFNTIGCTTPGSLFLFCGTPCQVAAVKNLWTFYNYHAMKLITCDLICHGVPSYLIYDSYEKHYSTKGKILSIDFRNKTFGWEKYSIKINYSNGKSRIIPNKKDMFMRSYLADMGLRESCYDCKFSRIPRVGDITLGDFWGVPNDKRNERGTSAIIANSEKGVEVLTRLEKEKRITLREVDINDIAKRNKRVLSGSLSMPREQNEYLNCLSNKEFDIAYRKYVKPIWLRKRLLHITHLANKGLR